MQRVYIQCPVSIFAEKKPTQIVDLYPQFLYFVTGYSH